MFRFLFLTLLASFSITYTEEVLKPKFLNIHDEIKEPALLDLKGIPSSTVHGCVNAITGNYFESDTDLFVSGASPYPLSRIYNSSTGSDGLLCYGWSINFLKKIRYQSKMVNDNEIATITMYENGSKLVYGPEEADDYLNLILADKIIRHGITNCSDGILSARHNLKNSSVYFCEKKRICIHTSEDKEKTEYKEYYNRYWAKNTTLANGCRLEYKYGPKNLAKLNVKGNQYGDNFGSFNVNLPSDFKKQPWATISLKDSYQVKYKFEKGKDWLLKEVQSDISPTIKYSYSKEGKLIKKELPDGRYRIINYVEDKDYVDTIYEPAGHDDKPIMVFRFKYDEANVKDYKRIKYVTKVFNGRGFRTEYFSTKGGRLASIQSFGNCGSYRRENFYWGDKDTYESSFLIARELKDYDNKTIMCRCYEYDLLGNATKEIFAGNVIGTSTTPPELKDGILVNNGCPTYVKNYTYNSSNLVKSESDGTETIEYEYYPETNLVKFKYIKDETGAIRERYYFEYDNNASLVKQIYDDGCHYDINKLEKVTERHTIIKKPTKTVPIGLPEVEEEYAFDLINRKETLIKMTVNTYNNLGLKTREETFDDQRNFIFAKEWGYDNHGNLIYEINAQGQTTLRQYDANGNCIFQQTPDTSFCTKYTYDLSNRLIKEEDVHADGTRLSQSYKYDVNSNCIAATDIYGNTTKFEYDEFDRCVLKIYPETENNDGGLYNPHEKIAYDVANNPIIKTDANGNTIFILFSAWGKPYYVKYADSATESSEYTVDGKLIKVIDPRGAITYFTYDYKKRKTSQKTYDPSGNFLTSQYWTYNAFHITSETDPNGIVTHYNYDFAGRLIQVRKGDKITQYAYDSLGRKNQTIEKINETQFRKTVLVYDNLDQVIEERIEDTNGEWIEKKSFSYDVSVRKTNETIYTGSTASTTLTFFNPYDKPTKITYPDGTQTLFNYRYDYFNEHGMGVEFQEEIDSKGNVVRRIMDTAQNLAQEIYIDPFGRVLKETNFKYDAEGNLTKRIDNVICEGKSIREVITLFEYDCRGNQTRIVEAAGTSDQKVTQKEYNFFGDVTRIMKPDGIILIHTYDYLGRLIDLKSTDGTVHYGYTYDLNHNVLTLIDYTKNSTIIRKFDSYNNLIEETFDDERNLRYTYDLLSRIKSLILPDKTSIDYIFDEHHIREIVRNRDEVSYSHKYEFYDYSSKIKKSFLPFGLGKIEFAYDLLLRPISMHSEFSHIDNVYDDLGNLVSSKKIDPLGEYLSNYSYDGLHQLVNESGFFQNSYTFDSLNNRTRKNDDIYENNALNQLVKEGDNSYEYDKNGNFTISGVRKCTYDALDRLISIEDESILCEYTYDAFHRRLRKSVYHKNNNEFQLMYEEPYLYQGEKEIGVYRKGKIEQLKILGLGVGDVGAAVALEISNKIYIPLHNSRGDIISLIDTETKNVCETYRYTAFGEEKSLEEDSINPWRFSSKRFEKETNWLFFGRRYYDPRIGRWTTPDPLFFEDGPNLYAYVKNRPMIFVDPKGLSYHPYNNFPSHNIFPNDKYSGKFLNLISLGFYNPERSCVINLCGRQFDKCLIMFVNGIMNNRFESQENALKISTLLGGCMVKTVYNSTYTLPLDLLECGMNFIGINNETVKLLHREWRNYFKDAPSDAIILQFCTSQGSIIVNNALETFNKELRKRIHVIAVGPGKYVNPEFCGSVLHLVSHNDIVPMIDQVGAYRYYNTIQYIKDDPNFFPKSHYFMNPIYEKGMRDQCDLIFSKFGIKI